MSVGWAVAVGMIVISALIWATWPRKDDAAKDDEPQVIEEDEIE